MITAVGCVLVQILLQKLQKRGCRWKRRFTEKVAKQSKVQQKGMRGSKKVRVDAGQEEKAAARVVQKVKKPVAAGRV